MTCAMCRASRMRVSVQHVCYLQSADASNVKKLQKQPNESDVISEISHCKHELRNHTELGRYVNSRHYIMKIILTEVCEFMTTDFTMFFMKSCTPRS